jgi:hypothetical protein
MRRILITLMMSGAVLVAVPGAALAQHHHARHHHARHHARHHRSSRRSSSVRHERFGRRSQDQPGSSSQAGTVTSFTDNGDGTGVLTITLNDGSTVTGNVTNDTNLECMTPNSSQQGDDNDSGDDNASSDNQGDDNASGDNQGDDNASGDNQGDDNGGNGDDNGDNGGDNGNGDGGQMCSTSSLTPGTPVAEANLEISGSVSTWQKVELVTA